MKKKIIKYTILLIGLIVAIFVGSNIYNYLKPMIVTGKIVEIEGKIEEVNSNYILIIDKDNFKYECSINKNTYYPNNYVPTVGDNVVAIYDYDEKIIKKNESLEIKKVIIKRIYKQKS
jgi:hypothetical protein